MATNSKEYLKERKKRLPRVCFEIPIEVKEALDAYSAEHNTSLAGIGRKALVQFMADNNIKIGN